MKGIEVGGTMNTEQQVDLTAQKFQITPHVTLFNRT